MLVLRELLTVLSGQERSKCWLFLKVSNGRSRSHKFKQNFVINLVVDKSNFSTFSRDMVTVLQTCFISVQVGAV
jgi:hypothetical protein